MFSTSTPVTVTRRSKQEATITPFEDKFVSSSFEKPQVHTRLGSASDYSVNSYSISSSPVIADAPPCLSLFDSNSQSNSNPVSPTFNQNQNTSQMFNPQVQNTSQMFNPQVQNTSQVFTPQPQIQVFNPQVQNTSQVFTPQPQLQIFTPSQPQLQVFTPSLTVSIFGFPPSSATFILDCFKNLGTITNYTNVAGSNFMTITYSDKTGYSKALQKNGSIVENMYMIGVVAAEQKRASSIYENTEMNRQSSVVRSLMEESVPSSPVFKREIPVFKKSGEIVAAVSSKKEGGGGVEAGWVTRVMDWLFTF